MAALDVLENEHLIARVAEMAPIFEEKVHSLKGCKHVTDIRNYGFAAGLTIAAKPGEPTRRPWEIAMECWRKGLYVRYGGDTLQLGLPFIIEQDQIDQIINILGDSLNSAD